MAYDLEEQEQLDEFKAWWKQHGTLISRFFIALLLAYAAYQAWHYYQNKQSVAGSSLYQELVVTDPKDLKSILAKSASLMEDYSGTPYAGRAALMAAKANYQAKQVASAKAQLEWAAKHASEASVEALANLQLASILFEEKDLNGALALLNKSHDAGFDGLFADLKGDVLAALGKNAEAKAAYQEALDKLDPAGKVRALTQKKLESLA
jgi:predicted negative regulator of RcsB-dependent stress response